MKSKDLQKLKPGTLLEILPTHTTYNVNLNKSFKKRLKKIEEGTIPCKINKRHGRFRAGSSLEMIKEKTIVMFVKLLEDNEIAAVLHKEKLVGVLAKGVDIAKEQS